MLLFEYEDIIRVSYEKENDLIVHEWHRYNPDQKDHIVLEILQKIYETLLETGASKVLVKVDKVKGVFSPEIHKYINDVQFPRLVNETNMRFVATVTNKSDMSSKWATIWKEQLAVNEPIVLHDVDTEEEGRAWLRSVS
jgi:hypothetical protein